MVITNDMPEAPRFVILKDGAPVGCVQRIDTETKTLWRYHLEDVKAWIAGGAPPANLVEESYDTLVVRES